MSDRVRRSRGVAHRQVEDQTVIIVPRTSEVVVLNGTGSVVWQLSDGENDLDAVVAEVAARFEAPPSEVRRDVEQLYQQLIAAGVAQPVP